MSTEHDAYGRYRRGERLTVAELDELIAAWDTGLTMMRERGASSWILGELSRDVERMRERRAEAERATKPGELEACATRCEYPRLCQGCALLLDATQGRR